MVIFGQNIKSPYCLCIHIPYKGIGCTVKQVFNLNKAMNYCSTWFSSIKCTIPVMINMAIPDQRSVLLYILSLAANIWTERLHCIQLYALFWSMNSLFKGPCSPKWLCVPVFLFWNTSFVKFSVLIRQSVHFFHTWPKCDSTHTEDGNFQLNEIVFLEYRVRKASWVNMGL